MLELTYKRILLIALPLMFGTFVQSVIAITDGAFVSELGNTAYTAVGNGSLMYMALFMICRGVADGTQITIAKKYGEEKNEQVGQVLFNAQIIQLMLTAIIFTLFMSFSAPFIQTITRSQEIGNAMTEFMQYRSWGVFFAGLQVTMAAFFIGLGRTNIIIFSTLIMAVSNILLDYGLIFGKLGLPELGMKGAPVASSISEVIAFLFLLFYAIKARPFQQFKYSLRQKFDKAISVQLFKLSYPLMGQGLVSLSTWLFFFGMIEHLGSDNLEIAHNIRYMYFIAFVPIFGFASATRTYVSNLVGRDALHLIPKVQFKIAVLSLISIILLFHGALIYPDQLIRIVEHNPDVTPALLETSADALRFVSGSIILFAITIIPFHSVSGLGKTNRSFLIELISIIIYLIACYFFIIRWEWNIVQIWWVEYIYFGSLGLLSTGFLFCFFRKQKINKEISTQ